MKTVFFDLDGTLADTAPDLADACNQILAQFHRPAVPLSEFRQWVHGGALLMICESFKIDSKHPDYQTIRSAFLHAYQRNLANKTQLFPGIEQVLNYLDQTQIPWGIITNKLTCLTKPLLTHLNLTKRCCCIVSGDTVPNTKPHPEPLLHACKLAQIKPEHCLYVGDTLSDIQAAKAAGMRNIAVSYGYRPKDSHIEEWCADTIVATPEELLSVLKNYIEGK